MDIPQYAKDYDHLPIVTIFSESHLYIKFCTVPSCLFLFFYRTAQSQFWLGSNMHHGLVGHIMAVVICSDTKICVKWTVSSEFGTYSLCEQRRFRRACVSAQSRQNLRCSLIQAVSQEEPSDRKPDPWPLWMAGHAQLKFVMTECSKTQIRLTGLIC